MICVHVAMTTMFSARGAALRVGGAIFLFLLRKSRQPVDDTGTAGQRMHASVIKIKNILVMLENILADLLE